MLRDLWIHRGYIIGGAMREIRQRYAGSLMGILWHVVAPLVQILVYFVVFSRFMGARGGVYSARSYVVYLCAGILPWFVFSDVLSRGAMSLLANEGYLKKLAIPEIIFVAQTVVTSGFTLAFYTVALALMAALTGVAVHWTWLLVPVVMALFLALAFGVALVLGVLTVFFRDVVHVLSIALQVLFWLTPVVYHESAVGPGLQQVIRWNPLATYILSVRDLLIGAVVPDATRWAWMAGFALLAPAVGVVVLRRLRSDLRDAL
jgi:lipopolysaccharide transport system permease protein